MHKHCRLDKYEREALRMVSSGQGTCPSGYPAHRFNNAVHSLHIKGLVYGAFEESGGVVDSHMTPYGRQYMAENPSLRNPIDWKWAITTAIASVGVAVGIVALFVACYSR